MSTGRTGWVAGAGAVAAFRIFFPAFTHLMHALHRPLHLGLVDHTILIPIRFFGDARMIFHKLLTALHRLLLSIRTGAGTAGLSRRIWPLSFVGTGLLRSWTLAAPFFIFSLRGINNKEIQEGEDQRETKNRFCVNFHQGSFDLSNQFPIILLISKNSSRGV
ncbi:MAG: hypothetical protein HYZ52_05690 [Candidatus Omnitrophica bacterium]|nr:hypothetical protein [Candidatus Omnitrophota bacterium]